MNDNATAWAERWLYQQWKDNDNAGIAPTENAVIARLLESPQYTRPVYARIGELTPAPMHRESILQGVLSALVAASHPRIAKIVEARQEVRTRNAQIAEALGTLASLFKQRAQYTNDYGLAGTDDYHLVDWIEAGLQRSDDETKHRGANHIMPVLTELAAPDDLKYWPKPSAVLEALVDAQQSAVQPADPALRTALRGYNVRTSQAVRMFLDHIDRLERSAHTPISRIRFTDEQVAGLLTAVGIDISQDAVKKTRRRLEKRGDISRAER